MCRASGGDNEGDDTFSRGQAFPSWHFLPSSRVSRTVLLPKRAASASLPLRVVGIIVDPEELSCIGDEVERDRMVLLL